MIYKLSSVILEFQAPCRQEISLPSTSATSPPRVFQCKICDVCRTKPLGSGYTNLLSHLDAKHDEYREKYALSRSNPNVTLESLGFINTKNTNMSRWVRWLVETNQPFSEVGSEETRGMSALQPLCIKSLMKAMTAIKKSVETTIASELPSTFGL